MGQCSATVALPIVSACGVECAVLPSVVLSNHTGGFAGWTFRDMADDMADIERQWIELGVRFDAFYTGYVCEGHVDRILSVMSSCAADGAVRIVDPVLGDGGRMYAGFSERFPAKMARLCAGADFILPNITEAALLVGEEPRLSGYSRGDIERLAGRLLALGAKCVVLTGVSFAPGEIGFAVADGKSVEFRFGRMVTGRSSHGAGDVFASVFAGALMRGRAPVAAASLAAETVLAALEATDAGHWYGMSFEKTLRRLAASFDDISEE